MQFGRNWFEMYITGRFAVRVKFLLLWQLIYQ